MEYCMDIRTLCAIVFVVLFVVLFVLRVEQSKKRGDP